MIEKQLNNLTPTKLRIILLAGICLLIIASAAGFWFFRSWLITYSDQVSQAAKAASVSTNDIANLQKLKTQLEDDKVAVTRTKNIVADSQSYQYQDQIINDLSIYAKVSGLSISSYSFESDTAAGTAAAGQAAAPQTVSPTGLKSTSVSVQLKNPVSYSAIIGFVHAIEANLTKMQLAGVSLTGNASSKDQVTASALTIEVYIR